MTKEELSELILELLQTPELLGHRLKEFYPATIAEALKDLEMEVIPQVLQNLPEALASDLFTLLEGHTQEEVAELLSSRQLADLITSMPSDDRVDFIKRLPDDTALSALEMIDKVERADITQLSAYKEGTVGSIMSTDYVQLPANITAAQAIERLRQEAQDSETIYTSFILDRKGLLVGTLTLKKLILSPPEEKIHRIMNKDLISIFDYDDQEIATGKIAQYDVLALPVVDLANRLVGIVTHDDVIDVLNQEHTEDMEKFMGITGRHDNDPYLRISVWRHFKNRIGWILGLAVLGFLSGMVLKGFEDVLDSLMVLALFMPMLADTGGNMGSQSASLIIRSLALGEITIRDSWKILLKEVAISALIALILAVVTFGRVLLLAADSDIPSNLTLVNIGLTIGFALGLQVISSTIIGTMLPIIATKLKLDPAVVASPAITTIVDVTGILIYFSLARHLLGVGL